MKIKDHAAILSRQCREGMRVAALGYQQARQRGAVARMTRWLILAAIYRDLARGYLEAA
jgi:hypothetical protein